MVSKRSKAEANGYSVVEEVIKLETDELELNILPNECAEHEEKNSDRQTAAHMFISFVGAGVLGLPYAFSRLGLLGSVIVLPICGLVATYAMIVLVQSKVFLQSQGKVIRGYGDIAFYALGNLGAHVVNVLIMVTQTRFAWRI